MAAPVSVAAISAMVQTKVSLTTEDGVYTGVVYKHSNKNRVILTDVTCINDRTEQPVRLNGMITIMAEEILNYECMSLPQPTNSSPTAKPSITQLVDAANPLSEVVKSLNRLKQPPSPTTATGATAAQSIDDPTVARRSTDTKTPVSPLPTTAATAQLHNGVADIDSNTSLLYSKSIPFEDLATSRHEYNDKRPKRYVVVEKCEEMFHEAIDLIKSQVMIGVGFDGIELGRHGQLCWIEISTRDIVILFDIASVLMLDDVFDKGLREIFESTKILKILHDCRHSSDFLKHQFRVTLTNVYDTQVADIIVFRDKSRGMMPSHVRSLDAVLSEFVGLSRAEVAFCQIRKSSLEKDVEIWRRRPQSPMLCEVAALSVRYLRELRLATLEAMMHDFIEGVQFYLDMRSTDQNYEEIDGDAKLPKEFLKFGPMVGGRDVLASVRMRQSNVCGQYVQNGPTSPGSHEKRGGGTAGTVPVAHENGPANDHVQQRDVSNVQFFPAGINMNVFQENNRPARNRDRRTPRINRRE